MELFVAYITVKTQLVTGKAINLLKKLMITNYKFEMRYLLKVFVCNCQSQLPVYESQHSICLKYKSSSNCKYWENVILPTVVLTTVVLPTTVRLLPFCLLSRRNGDSDSDGNNGDDEGLGSPAGLG